MKIKWLLSLRGSSLSIYTYLNARLLGSCFKTSNSLPLYYPPIKPPDFPSIANSSTSQTKSINPNPEHDSVRNIGTQKNLVVGLELYVNHPSKLEGSLTYARWMANCSLYLYNFRFLTVYSLIKVLFIFPSRYFCTIGLLHVIRSDELFISESGYTTKQPYSYLLR